MYIKNIKYTDFDGNEREETHYFNISRARLVDMQLTEKGGLDKKLSKILKEQDNVKIYKFFKKLIKMSYGIKSPDGRDFIIDKKVTKRFMQSEAYSELIMEFMSDPDEAATFVNSIIPKGIGEDLEKRQAAAENRKRAIPAPNA